MNIEEIVFVLNLSKIDCVDILIEDFEIDSEEEYINSLLKNEGLSFPIIQDSTVSIVYYNNQLNLQFFNNTNIYKISNLDLIDKGIYFQMLEFFEEPQKAKIINPTYQVGGVIDTNYGIKFTIQLKSNKKQFSEKVTDKTIEEILNIPCNILDNWKKQEITHYNRKVYEIIKNMDVNELKTKSLKISDKTLTF